MKSSQIQLLAGYIWCGLSIHSQDTISKTFLLFGGLVFLITSWIISDIENKQRAKK